MAHLILIEPDRLLAETYRQALALDGHTVVPCASAQAAIMAADQHQPDVVIVELQLIEHSGIEFLYEFRSYREWQDVPVIINTSVPTAEFASQWQILKQQLGISQYLYKTASTLLELRDCVQQQLVPA